MRGFLTAAIFLASVIPKGSSLVCEVCQNYGKVACYGVFHLCRPGITHCSSTIRETIKDSKRLLIADKYCLEPSMQATCEKAIIIRSSNIFLQIIRHCCSSDRCNRHKNYEYPARGTANGFKCPICFNDRSSNGCESFVNIPCEGNEDQCATFRRAGGPEPGFSWKACATKIACDYGVASLTTYRGYRFDLKCIPANKF
ncbi:phospholipase A2 inhibitor and Ly6/PLAUR domain-containing protein-like [Lissotriton helveticus]